MKGQHFLWESGIKITRSKVAVFGIGGSALVNEAARCPVIIGTFGLLMTILYRGNMDRQHCWLYDIGQYKVDVMEERVKR